MNALDLANQHIKEAMKLQARGDLHGTIRELVEAIQVLLIEIAK